MASKTPIHTFTLTCGHVHKSFINSSTFDFRCGECGPGKRHRRDLKEPIYTHVPGLDRTLVSKRKPAGYTLINVETL